MKIIPAILTKSKIDIDKKVNQVNGLTDTIQIDICDEIITNNTTWKPNESDELVNWENINYQFDLMVDNVIEMAQIVIELGASEIIVHTQDKNKLRDLYNLANNYEVRMGVVVSSLEEYISVEEYADFIQIMGIDNIGRQGEIFNENRYKAIEAIKNYKSDIYIQVDGGVNINNINKLNKLNVDAVAVGSAIYNNDNVEENIQQLIEAML